MSSPRCPGCGLDLVPTGRRGESVDGLRIEWWQCWTCPTPTPDGVVLVPVLAG